MTLGPFRRGFVAPLGWCVVAVLWAWQFFQPWVTTGLLSRSTMADAYLLIRGGSVDDYAPTGAGLAVLALPLFGALLVLLAGLGGYTAIAVRALLAVLGSAGVLVATQKVPMDDAGLASGAHLAIAGAVVALLTLAVDVAEELLARRSEPLRSASRIAPRVVAGTTALVLGLGLGVFVVVSATQHRGGAEDPLAAVEQLVDAVVERDGVAALALIPPDQRKEAVATFRTLEKQMGGDGGGDDGEPGLTDAVSFDLEPADLEFELASREGDRATVQITAGEYAVRVDFDALPGAFGVLKVFFEDGAWRGDLGAEPDEGPVSLFTDGPLTIPIIEVDGRWYVSEVPRAVRHVQQVLVGAGGIDLDELPDLLLNRLRDRAVGSLVDRLGLGD